MEPEQQPPVEQSCAHCQQPVHDKEYCDHICRSGALCQIQRSLVHCEQRFQRYQWLRELAKGVGQHGVIYLVYNRVRKDETVIKVQAYVETFPSARERCDREMIVACRVSGRVGFLRLYDYWICNVKPVDHTFRRAANKTHLYNQDKLYYMEMQQADGTLQDLLEEKTPLHPLEKLAFLFELLFVLNEARRDLGFYHGDLNTGNIFYVMDGEPRTYVLPDTTHTQLELQQSIFRPLVGDFGTSRLGEKDPAKYEQDLDWIFTAMDEWGVTEFILTPQRRARLRQDGSYDRLLVALANRMHQLATQ